MDWCDPFGQRLSQLYIVHFSKSVPALPVTLNRVGDELFRCIPEGKINVNRKAISIYILFENLSTDIH